MDANTRRRSDAESASRRKLLAKVHIAKKQLGLEDDVYRDVAARVTGERSARDMDSAQLGELIAEFRRLGWEPRSGKGKRPSEKGQVRMIWALWKEMGEAGLLREPTRAALRSFVFNATGVSDPEWLSPRQASNIINRLRAWKRRGGES